MRYPYTIEVNDVETLFVINSCRELAKEEITQAIFEFKDASEKVPASDWRYHTIRYRVIINVPPGWKHPKDAGTDVDSIPT